jgi:hypothetical protein
MSFSTRLSAWRSLPMYPSSVFMMAYMVMAPAKRATSHLV